MSSSDSESDLNISVYDPEDNLNFYGSPVRQQSEDHGETYRDLAEQVNASHPSRTQVS